jgi:hypothetical protein
MQSHALLTPSRHIITLSMSAVDFRQMVYNSARTNANSGALTVLAQVACAMAVSRSLQGPDGLKITENYLDSCASLFLVHAFTNQAHLAD